jgi:hypothetical protein
MSDPVCPKCGRPLPEKKISCPSCAQRKSRDALRGFQFHALLEAARGAVLFTVHKLSSGEHVQMFAPRGWKNPPAFCGAAATAPRKKRYPLGYRHAPYALVCAKCRDAIEELLVEAQTAEAMKTS